MDKLYTKKNKFESLYKFLKNLSHENQKDKLSSLMMFDIQVFMEILFFLCITKFVLIITFFIIYQEFYYASFLLSIIQLIISYLFRKQNIITTNDQRKKLSPLQIFLKYIFVLAFFLEEHYTTYYSTNSIYFLNPMLIYFVVNLILMFDSKNIKHFIETLVGLYTLNFLFLIYFLSFKNLMVVFIPINLVNVIFALINIISVNFNKKLNNMQIMQKFLENLIEKFQKISEFSLLYNGKLIFKNGIELDKDIDNDEYNLGYLNSEQSDSSYHSFENKGNQNFVFLPVNEKLFNGVDLIFKENANLKNSTKKLINMNQQNITVNMNLVLETIFLSRELNVFEIEEMDNFVGFLKKLLKNDHIRLLFEKNKEFLCYTDRLKFIILFSYLDSFFSKNVSKPEIYSQIEFSSISFNIQNKIFNFNVNQVIQVKILSLLKSLNISCELKEEIGKNFSKVIIYFSDKITRKISNDMNVQRTNTNLTFQSSDLSGPRNLNERKILSPEKIRIDELRLGLINQQSSEFKFPDEDSLKILPSPKLNFKRSDTKTSFICDHPNVILICYENFPNYFTSLRFNLKSYELKGESFNMNDNEFNLNKCLKNSLECINRSCLKLILIEKDENSLEKYCTVYNQILEIETNHSLKFKKCFLGKSLILSDKIDEDFFQIPLSLNDITSIIKKLD